MPNNTDRIGLPYILQSQSQKEVTHNDGLGLLDMLVQAVVQQVSLNTPPASPVLGDCYIVGGSPTGVWVGSSNKIAQAITGGWRYYTPFNGLSVFNITDSTIYRFNGTVWASTAISLLQNLSMLGINATADATNKLSVNSSAILLNNIGNGIQIKVNKNAAGDSGSFLFQTGFSARAEFGLLGDDNFTLKVSPNGSTFFDSLKMLAASGRVALKSNGSGLSAAGTTQATATAITKQTNEFTTVGAGQGAILPSPEQGEFICVANAGANALAVYPATGHKSDSLYEEVEPDWSGFKKSPIIEQVYEKLLEYLDLDLKNLFRGQTREASVEVLTRHRDDLRNLSPSAMREVAEFTENFTKDTPTVNKEVLSSAVLTLINIEKSKAGKELLEKISKLSDNDIDGLNRILDEWSVKDALIVLDEIDRRLKSIALIDKLAADPTTDELNTLHPLITQCRWVFGPEYESAEYSSNVTLRTAALKLFKKLPDQSTFKNSKKRPDIIVLQNSTISFVGTEKMEEDAGIVKLENVLIIELKKGNSSIGREEMNQADGYVQDILSSDLLDGNPQVRAFVVGHKLDPKTDPVKNIGDPTKAKIKAITFGQITRTAEQRLFKLKKHLSDRYDNISDSSILDEVLNNQEQDLNLKKA